MLEHRHDIGECLVEGEHIRIGPLLKPGMQSIEQRMSGLVRDDVVGDRAEHLRSRQGHAGVLTARAEIAEQKRHFLAAVIGVFFA